MMADFPEEKLWESPGRGRVPRFHLQHLSGVLSRLFTYARGEALTPAQRDALKGEGAASRPTSRRAASSRPSGGRSTSRLKRCAQPTNAP